jgi:hypothetical protein
MDPQRAYRAYLIGWDGHIIHRVDLDCEDDKAAKGGGPNCSSTVTT